MVYQLDDIQQALNEIIPVTPLRPLSWDEKLSDDTRDGWNTYDLGDLTGHPDTDKFYQLCKTRMTPEEYLSKWSWAEDVESNFDQAEPNSTKYQIFLRLKISCDWPSLLDSYSKQAVWDSIVYGKLYQHTELPYDGVVILKHDLMKHIFQYIPDNTRKRLDDQVRLATKNNASLRHQPEQNQLMFDRWIALYSE